MATHAVPSPGAVGPVAKPPRSHRWLWRTLATLVVLLLLYTAAGFLLVPYIAKKQIEKIGGEQLSRPVTVERVRFNPFSLLARIDNLKIGARDGDGSKGQPLFTLGGLEADAAWWRSITQRAPVLSSLKIQSPRIDLTRDPNGRYSIQDLIDKFTAAPTDANTQKPADDSKAAGGKDADKKGSGVPGFSVANIELVDGGFQFHDELKKLEQNVTAVAVNVPFISSLPDNEKVTVEPKLEATINGAKFAANGASQPFSATRDSTLNLNLGEIDLTQFVAYSPQALPITLASGKLRLNLVVTFSQPPDGSARLGIDGSAGLSQVDVRETTGEPLLKVGDLNASGLVLKPLEQNFHVGSVAISGLEATVHRRDDQQTFFQGVTSRLKAAEAKASDAKPAEPAADTKSAAPAPHPLRWKVDEVKVEGAKVDFADALFQPKPLAVQVAPLNVKVDAVSSEPGSTLSYHIDAQTQNNDKVQSDGKVKLSPLAANGDFKLADLSLKSWWWIAQPHVAADLVSGTLGAEGKYDFSMPASGMEVKVEGFGLKLSQLAMRLAGRGAPVAATAAPPFPALAAGTASFDVPTLTLVAASSGPAKPAKAPVAARAAGAATKGPVARAAKPAGASGSVASPAAAGASAATAAGGEFINIPELTIADTSVDLAARRVDIGAIDSHGGRLRAVKRSDGRYDLLDLVPADNVAAAKDATANAADKVASKAADAPVARHGDKRTGRQPDRTTDKPPAQPADQAVWQVMLKHLAFDQYAVDVLDQKAGKAADLHVDNLKLGASDLGLVGDATARPGKIDVSARVNTRGSLAISGPLAISPLSTKLNVDIKSLSLLPAQPYFTEYVNAQISGGFVSAKGEATVEMPKGKPSKILWRGDAGINDFAALSRQSNTDLLRWKVFQVKGIDLVVEPLKVRVDDVVLSDFYARVILSQQARLNLQDLLVKTDANGKRIEPVADAAGNPNANAADLSKPRNGAASTPIAPGASASPAATNANATGTLSPAAGAGPGAAASASDATAPAAKDAVVKAAEALPTFGGDGKATKPVAPPSGPPPDVKINKITLTNGNVDFSDFFVRPNYTANLTGLTGTITQLSPQTTGEVALKGRVNNAGTLDINGKLNPFSTALTMDVTADARDIDLPRMSPYSIKYIGYGIERGKLSAQVNYKIVDRQLTATNKIVLDQFTLGDKVPSPTALNLPVQFALSLLKDRNGVIDVELPITGSIDDPQFSIGGIVLRLIVNIIVKAVTSPFSLLSGLAGGNSAQLSQIPFAPGRADLSSDAVGRLEKIAKALTDRPSIKVDVSGRADAGRDSASLRELRLDRQMKALKVKANVEEGTETSSALDQVQLSSEERTKYLAELYKRATFDKPKNALGFTKDVPPDEMRRRLLDNARSGEQQLSDLANRRAQAVKDWLGQDGKVASERLYITSSKIAGAAAGADSDKPPVANAPTGDSKSTDAGRPGDSSKSADTVTPGDAPKSADASKPADLPKPADSAAGASAGTAIGSSSAKPAADTGVELTLK